MRAAAGRGLPALPFPPPSLTQYKRFFHSLDKHSSDFGAFLNRADLESSRIGVMLTECGAKRKFHLCTAICMNRSFSRGFCPDGRPGDLNAKTQRREVAKSLFRLGDFAVLYRKVAHFWQSFSASVFSVCSCSNSLVAACRAAPSAPFGGYG